MGGSHLFGVVHVVGFLVVGVSYGMVPVERDGRLCVVCFVGCFVGRDGGSSWLVGIGTRGRLWILSCCRRWAMSR